MNSFFISEDYITLLEASAIDGNVHATMYKLNSKTHKLLGYRDGVLKSYHNDFYRRRQEVVNMVIEYYKQQRPFNDVAKDLGMHYVNLKWYLGKDLFEYCNTFKTKFVKSK